jgi:succinylglutamate desuccinylase
LLEILQEDSIDFLKQKLVFNAFNLQNVTKNYHALKIRLDKVKDEKEKEELLAYIKNQCELIVVITEDPSDAFQFFDSQNARGKQKNYFI